MQYGCLFNAKFSSILESPRHGGLPYKLLPSATSCFPAVFVTPDNLVSSSEKCRGAGTLMETSSNGKYLLEGKPPPSEIIPAIDH